MAALWFIGALSIACWGARNKGAAGFFGWLIAAPLFIIVGYAGLRAVGVPLP